ncbi:MAG: carotenoid oxygenase family protein, partial [Caldimonas sp.]
MPGVVEFPRVDPRRIGIATRHVASAASWKDYPMRHGALFHGVQLRDLQTGKVDRFDYGERMVVEEHIVVPRPGSTNELDAWLVGTTFDAKRKVSIVNVLDARRVGDGPIAQAALPYWLPLGFHGNFTAT